MGRPQVEEGPHHGEEGMLDENEVLQLDWANARDAQRLFLEGMINHHTGATRPRPLDCGCGGSDAELPDRVSTRLGEAGAKGTS
jgi:Domain of unknown function (DUF305)